MKKKKKEGEVSPGDENFVVGLFELLFTIFFFFVVIPKELFDVYDVDKDLIPLIKLIPAVFIPYTIYMILLPFTNEIKYDEDGMTVKRMFRKERHFTYEELGQVRMWPGRTGPTFDLCRKDGRKIMSMDGTYYGLLEFILFMEQKGLAPGASAMFGDIEIEEEVDEYEEISIEPEYEYREVPVVRGLLTGDSKEFLGVLVNEDDDRVDSKSADFVLYDVENKDISYSFKSTEVALPFAGNYSYKSSTRGVSDKGAYFFSEGIFDKNNVAKEFSLYVYDINTMNNICSIKFSGYFSEKMGGSWNHNYTLEDAIMVNDNEIIIGIVEGYSQNPFATILKYDIKKRTLMESDRKYIQEIDCQYKCLFDLSFIETHEGFQVKMKCSKERCPEYEPYTANSWDCLSFNLIDGKLSDKPDLKYRYNIEENSWFSTKNYFESDTDYEYDALIVEDKDGDRIVELVIPRRGYMISAFSQEIPFMVYTVGEKDNSRSYVLGKKDDIFGFITKIETAKPVHIIDEHNKAIILQETSRSIILQ